MRIAVTCEHILYRTPDGKYWAQGAPLAFWERYCDVFEQVTIVGRTAAVDAPPSGSESLDDPRVTVSEIPYYRGPAQFARRVLRVRQALDGVARSADAVLLRVPSTLANVLGPMLRRRKRPYAVEVLGDPYDVFAPGVVKHPLRPLLRRWFARSLRTQCRHASAAAYVTQSRLQKLYPPGARAFQTHYSSLALPDDAFIDQPRPSMRFAAPPHRLITIAKLAQLYKGVDVLIDAVAECVQSGLDLRLDVIGDGAFRQQLEQQAASRRLTDRVRFHGHVASGKPVYDLLDAADAFVLPSRTEGLPRSMIEAMARALPCVGSTAGGIPELLPAEFMVPPGSVAALACKLHEVLGNAPLLAAMSADNRRRVEDYRPEKLRARRVELYSRLHLETAQWLAANCARNCHLAETRRAA